jgi:molybdopterin-guanine dinucleotide biosynthesis protein B
MQEPKVLGLAGWSGSGKTTLMTRLLPLLVARGLRVATLKHAHHDFDVDVPGKDSHEHRRAGASEVIVSSARRWAQVHELRDEPEPSLADLLQRVSPCDLILVEGFKRDLHPKLEVYRPAVGKPPLFPTDPGIVAVASDSAPVVPGPRWIALDDTAAVAACILELAQPLAIVLPRLAEAPRQSQGPNTSSMDLIAPGSVAE